MPPASEPDKPSGGGRSELGRHGKSRIVARQGSINILFVAKVLCVLLYLFSLFKRTWLSIILICVGIAATCQCPSGSRRLSCVCVFFVFGSDTPVPLGVETVELPKTKRCYSIIFIIIYLLLQRGAQIERFLRLENYYYFLFFITKGGAKRALPATRLLLLLLLLLLFVFFIFYHKGGRKRSASCDSIISFI